MFKAVFDVINEETLYTSAHLVDFAHETLFSSFGYRCDSGTGACILFAYHVSILSP